MDNAQTSVGEEIFATQRKYWDAWFDLTRQTLSSSSPNPALNAGTWTESLYKWWELIAPGTPPAAQEFYERMLGLGRAYFGFAEQVAAHSGQDSGTAFEQWLENLQHAFQSIAEGTRTHTGRGARDVLALWDLPLDTWQRTMSSMLPVPGDYLHALQDQDVTRVAENIKDRFDRFFAIPAVGYSRESQDQFQKLARLLLDYLGALQQYNVAFARIGMRSIENFRGKVEAAGAAGPIDSLRKLYDLWVDANEEVYGEYVTSEEYTRLYGHMVNALMAVKRQGALLVDEALEAMNIPTRRELNTVHQRLHDLRRDNQALRAEIAHIRDLLGDNATAGPGPIQASMPAATLAALADTPPAAATAKPKRNRTKKASD